VRLHNFAAVLSRGLSALRAARIPIGICLPIEAEDDDQELCAPFRPHPHLPI